MDRLDEWIEAMRAAGSDGELFGFFKELRAAREELAELRELAAGSYTVGWTWQDGELVPEEYLLHDEDGPVELEVDASGLVRAVLERQGELHRQELAELRRPLTVYGIWTTGNPDPIPARIGVTADGDDVELMLDALPLVEGALERQAKAWVRAAEETPTVVPLEQLLALVPAGVALELSGPLVNGGWWAAWSRDGEDYTEPAGEGEGKSRAAAIRAATLALLRVERRCETCAHWGTEEEGGHVRSCRRHPLLYARTADSSCLGSGDWAPLVSEPERGDGEGER